MTSPANPSRTGSATPAVPRGPWPRVPTAVVAAATLAGGFAAAQATGVRAVGGAVLVAGVAWSGWRALPAAGPARVAGVLVLGAGCFVASHLLAPHLGAWPSVALVTGVLAAGTAALVDRPRR
ncbi:hypothetical protein [Cellulomonas sp. ES6]|uniref:hypothetical protein n=1 Tax=Cellulomonas sp. ES6 TaxID=3039384 RepID=UPI0024B7806C|nr:hypothetical protein [Cellulomonas sp. ES6]WHP17940.1 hypothetical protein P9841_01845 [Cellulomonas sp. ES6]